MLNENVIPRNQIEIVSKLSSGQFGYVYKGKSNTIRLSLNKNWTSQKWHSTCALINHFFILLIFIKSRRIKPYLSSQLELRMRLLLNQLSAISSPQQSQLLITDSKHSGIRHRVVSSELQQGLMSYVKSRHLGDIPGILINPCLHLSVQLARRKPPCTIRQNASTFFIEALIVLSKSVE